MFSKTLTPPSSNSWKIALITFFSSLYLYGHVGTLYLQARGLNLLQASSLGSIIVAMVVLAEVPTGIIADKIGRKKSVIIALLLQFIGEFLYIFSSTYLAFVGIAAIAGLGFAFSSGCLEALMYDTLPAGHREEQMKRAMGLKGAAYYVAFFAAPLMGSLLIPEFTLDRFLFTVILTACNVFIALIISLSLEEPRKEYQHREDSPHMILQEGIACIRGNSFLLWLVAVSVLTATFFGTLATLFQPYLASFGWSARAMGIASAAGAGLAVLIQANISAIEGLLGKSRTFTLSMLLPGIGYLLLGLATTPIYGILAFVVTYGTAEAKNPLLSSYQNGVIPEKIRATVLSLINLLVSLYAAIVGLTMGWLADFSESYSFCLAGGLILVFSVILRVDTLLRRQAPP